MGQAASTGRHFDTRRLGVERVAVHLPAPAAEKRHHYIVHEDQNGRQYHSQHHRNKNGAVRPPTHWRDNGIGGTSSSSNENKGEPFQLISPASDVSNPSQFRHRDQDPLASNKFVLNQELLSATKQQQQPTFQSSHRRRNSKVCSTELPPAASRNHHRHSNEIPLRFSFAMQQALFTHDEVDGGENPAHSHDILDVRHEGNGEEINGTIPAVSVNHQMLQTQDSHDETDKSQMDGHHRKSTTTTSSQNEALRANKERNCHGTLQKKWRKSQQHFKAKCIRAKHSLVSCWKESPRNERFIDRQYQVQRGVDAVDQEQSPEIADDEVDLDPLDVPPLSFLQVEDMDGQVEEKKTKIKGADVSPVTNPSMNTSNGTHSRSFVPIWREARGILPSDHVEGIMSPPLKNPSINGLLFEHSQKHFVDRLLGQLPYPDDELSSTQPDVSPAKSSEEGQQSPVAKLFDMQHDADEAEEDNETATTASTKIQDKATVALLRNSIARCMNESTARIDGIGQSSDRDMDDDQEAELVDDLVAAMGDDDNNTQSTASTKIQDRTRVLAIHASRPLVSSIEPAAHYPKGVGISVAEARTEKKSNRSSRAIDSMEYAVTAVHKVSVDTAAGKTQVQMTKPMEGRIQRLRRQYEQEIERVAERRSSSLPRAVQSSHGFMVRQHVEDDDSLPKRRASSVPPLRNRTVVMFTGPISASGRSSSGASQKAAPRLVPLKEKVQRSQGADRVVSSLADGGRTTGILKRSTLPIKHGLGGKNQEERNHRGHRTSVGEGSKEERIVKPVSLVQSRTAFGDYGQLSTAKGEAGLFLPQAENGVTAASILQQTYPIVTVCTEGSNEKGLLAKSDYRHMARKSFGSPMANKERPESSSPGVASPSISVASSASNASVPMLSHQAVSNAAFLFSPTYADGQIQVVKREPIALNDFPSSYSISTQDSRSRISSRSHAATIPLSLDGPPSESSDPSPAHSYQSHRRVRFSDAGDEVFTSQSIDFGGDTANKSGAATTHSKTPGTVDIPSIELKMSDLTERSLSRQDSIGSSITGTVATTASVVITRTTPETDLSHVQKSDSNWGDADGIDGINEISTSLQLFVDDEEEDAADIPEGYEAPPHQPTVNWSYSIDEHRDRGVTPLRSKNNTAFVTNSPYLRFQAAKNMFSGALKPGETERAPSHSIPGPTLVSRAPPIESENKDPVIARATAEQGRENKGVVPRKATLLNPYFQSLKSTDKPSVLRPYKGVNLPLQQPNPLKNAPIMYFDRSLSGGFVDSRQTDQDDDISIEDDGSEAISNSLMRQPTMDDESSGQQIPIEMIESTQQSMSEQTTATSDDSELDVFAEILQNHDSDEESSMNDDGSSILGLDLLQSTRTLGASYSSYRLPNGETRASSITKEGGTTNTSLCQHQSGGWLHHGHSLNPVGSLPFRKEALVNTNELNFHQHLGSTRVLNTQRTPVQARKWRELAAAAQKKEGFLERMGVHEPVPSGL